MSTSSLSHCPRCGSALDGGSVEGLCAKCLGALNFGTQTAMPGEAPIPHSPTLTPEQLAPHFPQLEIIECLGRGGMGVVYKARQKTLNRLVALKLLAPERADDPQFAARFEKEAQALAALNHPHIVAVYDFGKVAVTSDAQLSTFSCPQEDPPRTSRGLEPQQPLYFLLMEFVDGVNLRQLMRAKKLTPKEALSIVPPVCEALQCAHDHGIVHRDIKPENLLIDKAGAVKIADFGIAKMIGSDADTSVRNDGLRKGVSASLVAGTPDYAAPEQHARAASADHRADIYSLGVVLYEMLTGERPKDDIVPPSKRVQVDVRIDEIVLRALEKTPELRFQTAADFRTQVEATAGSPARESAHPRATKSGPGCLQLLVIIGVLALVIFGVMMALWWSLEVADPSVTASKTKTGALSAPVVLKKFTLEDKTISDEPTTIHHPKEEWGLQISGDSVEYLKEQMETGPVAAITEPEAKERTIKEIQARIENRKLRTAQPRSVRLYEVPNPKVEDCTVVYRAKFRTENFAGRTYLEMWCRFADQQEYFSRGIERPITEAKDWVECETPFFLKKGEKPVLIRLNVVIEGEGQVFAKDIELSAIPVSDSQTLSGAMAVRPSKPKQDTNAEGSEMLLWQMALRNSLGLLVLSSLMTVVFHIAHRQTSLLGFRLLFVCAAGQLAVHVIGFFIVTWVAMNFSPASVSKVSIAQTALNYALYAVGLAGVISLLRSRRRPRD